MGFGAFLSLKPPYSQEQIESLIEAVSIPTRLSESQLSELEQAGKRLATAGISLDGFVSQNTDASRWLRSAWLESKGQNAEAAELLAGLWDGYWGDERAVRLLAYARNASKAKRFDLAARPLADAAKATLSHKHLRTVDRLLGQLPDVPARRRCRIALLGSVTLDFWVPALKAQCYATGIAAEFHIGAYGQYQQEILDPGSATAAFKPDIVVLATDWRSAGFADESNDPEAAVNGAVQRLEPLWRQCRERLGAFVIQLNCEVPAVDAYGRLSSILPGGRARMLRRFNLALADAEAKHSGLAVLDVDQIASRFGKDAWNDAVLWNVAKQYPATPAIPLLTHHLTALIRAALGLSYKAVAVDLDGVLWGGVIGEDGLGGIQLGGNAVGEAFVAFQRYLKSLASRGVLLAACSKNNPDDARAPFREHREMALKEEDFAVFVANWNTKDQNLREIARLLNIGLDAIVFVDDNPMERAIIRSNVPEVEVVEMPKDPSGYIGALDAPLYFEALTITKEDRERGQSIRQNMERMTLESQAETVEDYLASLQMKVRLAPFDEADLPRVVQLIGKTNQFNLTTRRHNDADVRRLMALDGAYTQSLRVEDRFGDSGLTGVLIAVPEGDALRIDTWLMSCRVMGRRLEEAMFASLVEYATASGCTRIIGEYLPTAKNPVVAELYPKLGFERAGESRFEWRVDSYPAPPFLAITDLTKSLRTHGANV